MYSDYLPGKERDLRDWCVSFCGHLTATPTVFGETAATATALTALTTAFSDLLAQTTDPATRTPGLIGAKKTARRNLIAGIRPVVQRIQTYPGLTLQQRIDLGINQRDNAGRPINPPTEPPVVTVTEAIGRLLRIKVRGADSAGRRKPAGAYAAQVFTFVGDAPSNDPEKWACQGQTTRGNFDLQLSNSVPAGACVWISAVWVSPRGVFTQMSNPISAYVAGGIAAAGENTNEDPAAVPALKAA